MEQGGRMKAVQLYGCGGPDMVRFDEVARPVAGAGEVLIRVYAAGVNPLDWKLRVGINQLWPPHTFPVILGFDVAGVVEAVGSGVQDFAVGDEVFASPELGGYAEYVVVAAKDVAYKPQSLSFVEAAAMPIAAVTAWQALIAALQLRPHMTLLIHGATGGVGAFAVQLAKWRGSYVIGTASAGNLAYLRQLGADEGIDYRATRFEDVVSGVDAVLDLVGGDTLHRSWQVMRSGGTLVSVVQKTASPSDELHLIDFNVFKVQQPFGESLAALAELVEAGAIRPYVSAVFPLQEAYRAHALIESRHVRGKIVLQVGTL